MAQVLGLGVSQVAESANELTGSFRGEAVGALAEDALLSPMMSHGDHVLSDGEESETGEDLTDGGESEGGALHELRSFDSFNIQVSEGNGANGRQLVNWLPDPGGALKKPPCGGGVSSEDHARLKGDSLTIDSNEPLVGFLEDSLAGLAELREQSIEAALGGDGLPATIEDLHIVVTDLSDQVAMEINAGCTDDLLNAGVSRRPVGSTLNGGVHLAFDLAHLECV